jgi:hypothetical protein
MELTFPFKNMCISNLLRFLEPRMIIDFISVQKKNDPNTAKIFNTYIDIYSNSLPNFENELIQVIETTDQATIDTYFSTLSLEINWVRERFTVKNVENIVSHFNEKSLTKFNSEAEHKTEEYFKNDLRKLKHLEEYDGYDQMSLFLGKRLSKKKLVNYNFYCIDNSVTYIEPEYLPELNQFLNDLENRFSELATKYGNDWVSGEIKSRHVKFIKPILFVEGDLDIDYITKAAYLFGKEKLLSKIDLRQRGGFHNLDNLWNIFKKDNWETVPQKKIFLYDCDTEKCNEENGYNYKRVIPTLPNNPIKKGIENLFDEATLNKAALYKRALLDVVKSNGIKRGQTYEVTEYSIDKQEKRNLCDWICANGDLKAFTNFEVIFNIIEEIIC